MKKKLLTGMTHVFSRLFGASTASTSPGRAGLHLRALEPRVLLDAAAAATAAETLADAGRLQAQHQAEPTHEEINEALLRALAVAETSPAAQLSVVFIDSSVADPQQLIKAIGNTAEVHLLKAGEDGVQAIAAALAGRSGVDSVHIISHGAEGALQLGSAALDAASMSGLYSETLQGLRAALAPDADSGQLLLSGRASALNAWLATAAALVYRPVADFNGEVLLSITSSDGQFEDRDSTSIRVTPVADAVDDAYIARPGEPLSFNVLIGTDGADNFENPAAALVAITAPPAAEGTVSFSADGAMVFTPAAGFAGTSRFTYTVESGGAQETASVSITVPRVIEATPPVVAQPPLPQPEVLVLPLAHESAEEVRTARDTWPPVEVPLIVVDTVRALGGLHSTPTLGVEAPVLQTVNQLDGLNPTSSLDVPAPVLQAVNGVSALHSIVFGADGRPPEGATAATPREVEVGGGRWDGLAPGSGAQASQRMNATPQGQGGVEFNLHWREHSGRVEVLDQARAGEARHESMDATLADGSPLPSWIRVVDRSTILVDRPVGADGVALKLRFIYPDGSQRTELLLIGGRGEEVPGAGPGGSALRGAAEPEDFLGQLRGASRAGADRRLLEALAGR